MTTRTTRLAWLTALTLAVACGTDDASPRDTTITVAAGGQGGTTGGAASGGNAGQAPTAGAAGDKGLAGTTGTAGATSTAGATGTAGVAGNAGAAGGETDPGEGVEEPGGPPPKLPTCDCFVKVAWCGSGVAKEAAKMSCQVPLLPAHNGDILFCPGGVWTVKEPCAKGCIEESVGTPDACRSDGCMLVTPASAPYVKSGLHPDASDGFAHLGINSTDISQTIGNAPASAGYHAEDGVAGGKPYCAATDLRTGGMSEAEIGKLLDDLASVGFAAWYRKDGYDGWAGANHIHAVYAGAKMKTQLREQMADWRVGKNGLTSHTTYKFHTWSQCRRDAVWALFQKFN